MIALGNGTGMEEAGAMAMSVECGAWLMAEICRSVKSLPVTFTMINGTDSR